MAESKRKLLILGSVPPPIGGATIYFQTLLKTKIVEQFDVVFLDLKFADSVADYGRFSVRKIVRLIGYVVRLSAALLRNRFAIVYAVIQFNRGAFIKDVALTAVCRLFGKRVVGCMVGIGLERLYDRSGWLMKGFIRRGVGLYYAFVTPSLEMYTRYFPADLLPREKARVVPFGIFTDASAPHRTRLAESDPIRVIYYSHYIKTKGFDEVVGAIPLVEQKYPKTTFLFVGAWDSDTHRDSIMKVVESNGIAAHAKFLGVATGDVKKRYLQDSDIFVLPTYFEFEGLPLSILEAMSYGCAVIATDHAAIASVIEDGVNGLICRPRDSVDLAMKIISLIEDRDKLHLIQRNNIRKFQDYTAEKFGERLATELEALCDFPVS